MTGQEAASPTGPRVETARIVAREWFMENRGASWAEFAAWAREAEPRILTGYGWRPGRPLTAAMRGALDDAHAGLAAAAVDEARRRARRDVPLAGHRSPMERPAVPAARVGANPWRHGLQRDGAA